MFTPTKSCTWTWRRVTFWFHSIKKINLSPSVERYLYSLNWPTGASHAIWGHSPKIQALCITAAHQDIWPLNRAKLSHWQKSTLTKLKFFLLASYLVNWSLKLLSIAVSPNYWKKSSLIPIILRNSWHLNVMYQKLNRRKNFLPFSRICSIKITNKGIQWPMSCNLLGLNLCMKS